MKSNRKHISILAMLLLLVSMTIGLSVSAAAEQKIPKKAHAAINVVNTFEVELNADETLSKVTVKNSKILKAKVIGSSSRQIKEKEYAKDGYNNYEIGVLGKKTGTTKVTLHIKKGKKITKKTVSVTVNKNNSGIKSLKFAGKEYAPVWNEKLQHFVTRNNLTTKKKGKLVVKPFSGYRVKRIVVETAKKKTEKTEYGTRTYAEEVTKEYKNKSSVNIVLNNYNASSRSYKYSDSTYKSSSKSGFAYTYIYITLEDTWGVKHKEYDDDDKISYVYPTKGYTLSLRRKIF